MLIRRLGPPLLPSECVLGAVVCLGVLIGSSVARGESKFKVSAYRSCVAVFDADGAGQLTCVLARCVKSDPRANPISNAFASACSPSNPTHCLNLPMIPGCGGRKAMLMQDFSHPKLKPGHKLPSVEGEYHCNAFRTGHDSLRVECGGPRKMIINLPHSETAPPPGSVSVGSSPDCADLWNWCFGTAEPDTDACRDYEAYCTGTEP